MRQGIRGSGCEVESVPFPGEAIRGSRFLMADKTPRNGQCVSEFLFSLKKVFCFKMFSIFSYVLGFWVFIGITSRIDNLWSEDEPL
jgi:hypothetical protein